MFSMIIKAKTMDELKSKLFEAASAINSNEKHTSPVLAQTRDWPEDETEHEVEDTKTFTKSIAMPISTHSGSSELDSRGIPWDARIHSASKALNKDGSWRSRRGADDNAVRQIESQLKTGMEMVQAAPAYPQVPAAPVAPAIPQNLAQSFTPKIVEQPKPAPEVNYAPPIMVAPEASKPAHSFETFKANFVPTMSGLVIAGKINQGYIEQLKAYFKVNEIFDLIKSDQQLSELFETLCSSGLITRIG